MTAPDFDEAIIGGGCSGLSLAVELSERLPKRRIALLEARTAYSADRRWCHWALHSHRWTNLVTHRWTDWQVHYQNETTRCHSNRYPYLHIPSAAFYESALALLQRRKSIAIYLGCVVSEIIPHPHQVRLISNYGEITARRVFDSRPPVWNTANTSQVTTRHSEPLLQHFLGQQIRSDKPVFDPTVVTLMDFDMPRLQSTGIHFMYVLPFNTYEALMEATVLSTQVLSLDLYRQAIQQYLAARYAIFDYQIMEEERGVIPMAIFSTIPNQQRIYRMGTAGGCVKASTGYGFLAIQRWTEQMTTRLGHQELPKAPPIRSTFGQWLDQIFIAYLQRYPEKAPALFKTLFARVNAESLVRFLNDQATGWDTLAVMRAMPTSPFMAEALQSFIHSSPR